MKRDPGSAYVEPERVRLPRLSEADLFASIGPAIADVRPCACGRDVICDPRDVPLGVRAHQATPEHRSWREAGGLDREDD
jgi:hypothetical protein